MFDDGRYEDVSNQSGLGMQMLGREQIRQRRAADMQRRSAEMMNPQMGSFGPLKGLMSGANLGPLPDQGWDGYFGAMQGKENAVQAQGGRIGIDMLGSWGPQRSQVSWTTNRPHDGRLDEQLAMHGLRRGYR